MSALPEKKLDMYQAFKTGQFSVQLSCHNPFGRIIVDQATEVTVNKNTQTPGGTTGVVNDVIANSNMVNGVRMI